MGVSLPLHIQKSRFLVARCLDVVVDVRVRTLFIHKTCVYVCMCIYIYIYVCVCVCVCVDVRINLQFYKNIKYKYTQVAVDVRMNLCFIRP